jgi:O-antigen/teichoic acid export membrane protein
VSLSTDASKLEVAAAKAVMSERPGPVLHERSLRARFRSGLAWNAVGALCSQGSVLAANLIVANLLGKEAFGEFSFVQTTVLTLAGISQMATGTTATKYVAEHRATDKQRVGRLLALCSVTTLAAAFVLILALVLSAPWLATSFLETPRLSRELVIASAYVLFAALAGFQVGALTGLEAYRAFAIAGVFQGVLHVVLCGVATWGWGLEGAIIALVLSALARWFIVRTITAREAAKQGISVRYRGILRERSILSLFALPTMLIGISTLGAMWFANALLARQPNGFAEIGLFTAALNFKTLVVFFPFIANNVALSVLNNQKGIGESASYRKVFWANVGVGGATVLGAGGVIALAGMWLLPLYGQGFEAAYPSLLLLLFAAVFEAVGSAASQAIHSRERVWFFFFAIALPRDALVVLLAYWLAPLYGAYGLALAYSLPCIAASAAIGLTVYWMGLDIGSPRRTASAVRA